MNNFRHSANVLGGLLGWIMLAMVGFFAVPAVASAVFPDYSTGNSTGSSLPGIYDSNGIPYPSPSPTSGSNTGTQPSGSNTGSNTNLNTGSNSGSNTAPQTSSGASQVISFENPTPYDDIMSLLQKLLESLVKILLPVIAVFIIYAGFLFVTAGGDTKKLEDAKKTLLGALIGAALILGAWVFAQAIASTIQAL